MNYFNTNPIPGFNYDLGLETGAASYDAFTNNPYFAQQPQQSGGLFSGSNLGNLFSGIGGLAQPFLASNLAGQQINKAAQGYAQSAREAALIGGAAALEAQKMGAVFADKGEDRAQQRRYADAMFQLNMQKSKPFQDLLVKQGAMNIAGSGQPGAEMRAGRFLAGFA